MKKKIITIIAFIMLTITTTFAADNAISKNALHTFSGSFANATEVKWEKHGTYYTASFQMNGQALAALISDNGEMIAVYRNMLSTELPEHLRASLKNNFSGYWIADLAGYAMGGEMRYYATLEDANKKIILESADTYNWSVVRKNVKK